MDNFLSSLSSQELGTLQGYGFEAERFLAIRQRWMDGELGTQHNRLASGSVTPPSALDLGKEPAHEDERTALFAMGLQALESGKVATLILNGGMATRFGGVVKGCVDVVEGLSFLGLKCLDARAYTRVPLFLLNSFATHDATRKHLEEHDYFGLHPQRVSSFLQGIFPRLTPEGEVFRDDDGRASYYGPGHGDVSDALSTGPVRDFLDGGGELVLMSNVDNVLATLDPLMIGRHLQELSRGFEMTVECVDKYPGDTGGVPAYVDGDLQIVEHFRLPERFDADQIQVFNTNTLGFSPKARHAPLQYFVVEKSVGGRACVQFERLAGEMSAHLKTAFLHVERGGAGSRFLPVKTPADLNDRRTQIVETLRPRLSHGML